MKTFEVKIITSEFTRSLRYKVLWPHIQKVEDCIIDIDQRSDAIHLGVFDDEKIISIGSLFQMNSNKIQFEKQYRLRAMATDPDYRGQNAGRVLIEKSFEILKEKGVEVLWCDARKIAVRFYQSLGFSMLPEEYEVPKIGPHYFMWKEL